MLLTTDDLGGCAVVSGMEGAGPAETGRGEGGREDAGENWRPIGEVVLAVVAQLRGTRMRDVSRHPTIGETDFFALLLAALAAERHDRGEGLLRHLEASAGYLRERIPRTAQALEIACREARRLRGPILASR